MRKYSGLLVSWLFLLLAPAAAQENADGKLLRPSPTLNLGLIFASHKYYGSENANALNVGLQIPANGYVTTHLAYSYSGASSQNTFGGGLVLYTNSVSELSELRNPDGVVGSFVLAPAFSYGVQNRHAAGSVDLTIEYVASARFTPMLGYSLGVVEMDRSHTLFLGLRHHTKEITSARECNPDGAIGSITFVPIAIYTSIERRGGFGGGLSFIAPAGRAATIAASYQIVHVSSERITAQTISLGAQFYP